MGLTSMDVCMILAVGVGAQGFLSLASLDSSTGGIVLVRFELHTGDLDLHTDDPVPRVLVNGTVGQVLQRLCWRSTCLM